ncbi:MAG: YhdP family protein, partial [Caldimonas sp.]
PRVFAALSTRSLLALEPRFAQLLIDGASLDVRRDRSGRIRVAGVDFDHPQGAADNEVAADWFFKQHEFVIRAGTLRWIDEARDAPPLELADVELVVRNGLREHDVRIDATPPPGWGERFSLRGRFTQPLFARASDWRRWSGRAYVELPRADLSQLRRRVTLPFELSEGDGALRGWFDVKDGQATSASLDLALRAVALRLDKSVEPLEFEQVAGRIDAEQSDDRTTVAVRRFGFRTGDGLTWPQGDLRAAWRRDERGAIRGGEFDADRLDVGVMAEIASRVPIGAALRELLADVRPRGVITQLKTRWDGPLDAPERYRVKGRLSELSLAAKPSPEPDGIGRPGLANAELQLEATEAGGQARIDMRGGRLDLPGVFAERELPLDSLDARLSWKVDRAGGQALPRISVQLGEASFANADAKGTLTAAWRSGPGTGFSRGGRYPGQLELDGRLVDGVAGRTARYLPLGLPEGVRSYVAAAVREGTIASATFRIRGDLYDFPFHDPKVARDADFRIAARFEGLTFAYGPDETVPRSAGAAPRESWPALTAGSGELVVDRSTIDIKNAKAQLGHVEWSAIQGRIGELGFRPRLEIEGTAIGPLSEMLHFVDTTQVGRWTHKVLANASATGPAQLTLALGMPLARPAETIVKGSVVLAGNDVRITPDTPLLAGAKGRVDFSQRGFVVTGGTAHALGGELAFEGGSSSGLNGGDSQRFTARGTATAEGLRQAGELGAVARLAALASGQTGYRATLAFVAGGPQISVASNLVGLGIDLPAPLGKAAATPRALRMRTAPEDASTTPGEAGAAVRESLQVDFGGALQVHFVREVSGDSARVVRGAIRVGEARTMSAERVADPLPGEPIEAVPLPASGVAANVAVKKLDVDAWQAALARIQGEAPRAGGAGAAAPLVFDAAGGTGYVPVTIAVRAGEIELGSRRLANVTAGLTQQGELWRANVAADELEGYIEYRPARRASGAGRVFARLARLSLPKGEVERVESLLESQPASIPALDVVVDDFDLRGRRLGRLEIEATNRGIANRDGAREWQLGKLNLTMPEAQLHATGTWGDATSLATTATRRATMNFTLTLGDSGALLERLGMGRVVRGGKGSLTGEVSWPGSPFSPDYARMTGQVKVAIDSGQFLKAGPGAARLLSVLSLQSLPRRLLFDFRDLFAEGFAFDNVVGDVGIADGKASTNNLRMRGTAAAVLMEGSADIVHETEDLRVVVVPEINAGTASLAYAVINPAVGLGTFLAQYFLRKPLMAASTREFRVTGRWDDPKVERVERSLLGEATTFDPAAVIEPAPAVTR